MMMIIFQHFWVASLQLEREESIVWKLVYLGRRGKWRELAQLAHGKTEDFKLEVFSKFPCLKFFQGPHVSKQC